MFPQRRMTTDTPDGNYEQALNLFVRGEDGWVQMPSRSISLNDYMKQLIKAHNADIDTEGTPEEFDMTLCEHLFDGPETIEGLLAEHYTLSWALASLRDKLKHYEDALIPEIMPEGLQTIDRAIGTYGKDAQLTKAVEEMSELTKALCKLKECKRKYDTPFNRETQEVHSNIEEEYKSFVTKQTTYCNALRQWAKRETDPNVIGSIYYGCALPEDLEKEVGDILSAAQAQITAIINKLSA